MIQVDSTELQSANVNGLRNYFITAIALGSTSAMVLHRHMVADTTLLVDNALQGTAHAYSIYFPIGDHVASYS